MRIEPKLLTAEQLATIRQEMETLTESPYDAGKAQGYLIVLFGHIAALTGERDAAKLAASKARLMLARIVSPAWSLSQWNDHNFTRDDRERWRKMVEERCLEWEAMFLTESTV